MGTISEAPIYAKDVFGNQRDSGGDVFSASLQLLAPPYGNETVQVGDNGDGTYKAMWVVSRAGRYKLWVSGHCGAIKDAPFDVHCMPSALSFTHSLLAGEGSTNPNPNPHPDPDPNPDPNPNLDPNPTPNPSP